MSTLGDDEFSLILNLDQRLKWQKLTLSCLHAMAKSWVSGRLSIRVIEPDSLQDFLRKLPNLRSFDSTKFLSNAYLQIVARTCPKIQIFKVNLKEVRQDSDGVGDDGIC